MAIIIKPLASSSKGNAYLVSDEHSCILIECGIQFKQIQKAVGFKMSSIAGCLASHEHQDHCKAAKDIVRAGVDLYVTKGTADAIGPLGHRLKIIKAKQQFSFDGWTVLPFDVQHDAKEPAGFLIQRWGEKLLFATDTYFLKYKFTGLTHIMIECNYAIDIMKRNNLPTSHKKRVMQSHFSLDNVKGFLRANDLSKVREIYLMHLSDSNSDEGLFKKEIQQLTGKPVVVC